MTNTSYLNKLTILMPIVSAKCVYGLFIRKISLAIYQSQVNVCFNSINQEFLLHEQLSFLEMCFSVCAPTVGSKDTPRQY